MLNFPDKTTLKSGRIGKYNYPTDGPPELSAKIADFMGEHGTHFIAESRLQVLFDILAPNYRTAQKTWDLTAFWKNTYPQIRKELRGRYPRHPWPEEVL